MVHGANDDDTTLSTQGLRATFCSQSDPVKKSSTAPPSCPNMVTSQIKPKKKKKVSDSSKSKLKASKLSTDDLHLVISEPENLIHWKKSKEHHWWQLAWARVWLTAGSASSTLLLRHMVRWAVWLKSARDGWWQTDGFIQSPAKYFLKVPALSLKQFARTTSQMIPCDKPSGASGWWLNVSRELPP